jgi:hypothetical protein
LRKWRQFGEEKEQKQEIKGSAGVSGRSPIPASLLQLDSKELNKLALEVFISIMKYMGDYPIAKGQSEIDSVYTILMVIKHSRFGA